MGNFLYIYLAIFVFASTGVLLGFCMPIAEYTNQSFFVGIAEAAKAESNSEGPTFKDPNLIAEVVYEGLKEPTAMDFLGPDDILVLEKDSGTVQRIVDGKILPEPLLSLDITSSDERGMLGIAIAKDDSITTTFIEPESINTNQNVFLFFSESQLGEFPIGNRVYKYELVNDNTKLANPTLLIDLPAFPDDSHVGGVLKVGPDNNLYFVVGDQRASLFTRTDSPESQTKAQNYLNGKEPDGRSGILRITQDGETVRGVGILGDQHPLDKYYAYGIKNSFGFDFDPITGELWDTENGPRFGDEINLVEEGFNGGWANMQGIWRLDDSWEKGEVVTPPINPEDYDLVDFDGKGKYSSPEFTFDVAPTALKFLNSDKLGEEYENDMFVGDIKNGNLYHFELDEQRQGLLLDGPLADKVAEDEEIEQVVFGNGFGGITDIDVGPDGYLYVLAFDGTIYRIASTMANEKENTSFQEQQ
ncbi:MAG TPA: PQQ-dependent sugar dehydrogenase [Nitrososphaeraceae archaeon]|nr:PQQ-dependent sugar dehydrogenase [Nitrososphaeraceae archaeon]